MSWRKSLIAILLRCLNSWLLNRTLCRYGHIGNCEAFDYSFLDSSDKQSPYITIRQVLDDANRFKEACDLAQAKDWPGEHHFKTFSIEVPE